MDHKENYPKVSVLMPCYNHEKYVARAIESILNQTYPNIELIILDNGSTDNSYEIIQRYRDDISQILHFDKNDLARSGAKLLENATGDYIACTTSDDCWAVDKLEKQMKVLLNHPEIKVCFTWAAKIDDDYNIVQKAEETEFAERNRTREQWLEKLILGSNCFSYPSAVTKREYFFDITLKGKLYYQLSDKQRWINALLEGDIYVVEETLLYMMWHPKGENANMSAPSLETFIRTNNEALDIAKSYVENMQDELFIKVFNEKFRGKNVTTHEQVICEKFFLLMKLAESTPELEQEVISFYYRNNTCYGNNVYFLTQALEEYYNYSYMDFQNYCMSHGAGVQNMKRKELKDAKKTIETQKMYMQAMYDYLSSDLPLEEREKAYRKFICKNLTDDSREMISTMQKYIRHFLTPLKNSSQNDLIINMYEMYEGLKKAKDIFEKMWTDFFQYDNGIGENEWDEIMNQICLEEFDVDVICDKIVPFLVKFLNILNMYQISI